jgi:hypothetical protein
VVKPEGKRPLGRPRRRWVNNIKMDLREIGWDCMDWIDPAQDRDRWRVLVNTVMNLRVPQNAGKFLSRCRIGGSSRRAQLREWVRAKDRNEKRSLRHRNLPCCSYLMDSDHLRWITTSGTPQYTKHPQHNCGMRAS